MAEPFLGEIRMFGFNFAPSGWAFCQGQLLAISSNTALFSLLGTQYGGNGQSTFALPDLRSRVPIAQGQGSGLSNYIIGAFGGVESVTLSVAQIPAHSHVVNAAASIAANFAPGSKLLAVNNSVPMYEANPTTFVPMHPQMIAVTGGGSSHTNIQPFLALNFCIALQGIFPSRN